MTTLQKLEELIYKGFKETDARLAQHRRELEEQSKKHRRESNERVEQMLGEKAAAFFRFLSRLSPAR